ncbi:MAG: rhodanese-like domain-containing protein [Gammaproteobacteria bacterium]
MTQLTQFIAHHWMLVVALIIVLVLLLTEELRHKRGGRRISASDAVQLINREKACVLDIRDRTAYDKGHIVNAIHIPQADVLGDLEKIKKYRDKPLILVCNMGQNSIVVQGKLQKQGFNQVFVLAGGLQAWKNADLPLVG